MNVSDNISETLSTVTQTTSDISVQRKIISPGMIVLCTFFLIIAVVSAAANLFVLLAYKFEKKLRNTFAILIGNLAVADLIVSCFPMTFYTVNILYQYWPLGRVLCGIWVVVDYNSVFISSYLLAAISIDRLWSVKWGIHYHSHNTKKKAAIIVIVVWLLVFAVAMYPTISDRVLRTRDYYCHFVPAENPQFVIALALLGHHIPCLVIIVCYVVVFVEIRKLFKNRPGDRAAATPKTAASHQASVTSRAKIGPEPSVSAASNIQGTSRCSGSVMVEETNADGADEADNARRMAAMTSINEELEQNQPPTKHHHHNDHHHRYHHHHHYRATGTSMTAEATARAHRERKSFITLSYIVVGYVVCWVPFHFVYDVSFIYPEIVPEDLFTFTFWLTYVNSTINPFLYAFSSADLRNAVIKMLKCRCTSN